MPQMRKEMRQAAAELDFEKAAKIRDLINRID
ncbi:MAG: UvrB/UvrC motif-containing protein [Candidatus Shapirobacteria bacterium]|nr:UvrB/UvrC motif-containing protein [Candidatus Shapirobacteria bacterium]